MFIFFTDIVMKSKKLLLFCMTFVVFGFFAVYQLFQQREQVYAAFTDCANGSVDVVAQDCNGLQAFYNNVNGLAALWATWFQNDIICGWQGIICDTSSPKKKVIWISLSWSAVTLLSGQVPWGFYTGLTNLKSLSILYNWTTNTRTVIFSSSWLALITWLNSIFLWDCPSPQCVSQPAKKINFSPASQFSHFTTLTGLNFLYFKWVPFTGNTSTFQTWTHMSWLNELQLINMPGFSGSLNDFSGANLFPNLDLLTIICVPSMNIGGTLSGVTNLHNLVALSLNDCPSINGWIPDEIAQLSNLEKINFINLTWLNWSISPQFTTLSSLKNFYVSTTNLQGNTTELCWFTGLQTFEFGNATLTWSIPACLCDNTNMTTFFLSQASSTPTTWRITWPIPSCIGSDLTKLTSFILNNLNLSGFQLPSNFGNLTGLTNLTISQWNPNINGVPQNWHLVSTNTLWRAYWLTGPIPPTLSALTKLQSLILPMNSFVWSIPDIFWPMKALRTLNLSWNLDMLASLPSSLSSHTGLTALNLDAIPLAWSLNGLWWMPALTYLNIARNAFFSPLPLSYFNAVFPSRSANTFSLFNNLFYGKVPLSVVTPSVLWNRILNNNYCLDFSDILFSPWGTDILDTYPNWAWRNQQYCADISVTVTQSPVNPKQLDVVTYTISYTNTWPNPVSGWNLDFTKPTWLTGIIASRWFSPVWWNVLFSWSALLWIYASWWSSWGIYDFSTGIYRYFATTGQTWLIVLTGIMQDSGFSLTQITRINHITGSTHSGNEIDFTNNTFSLPVNTAQPVMNALSPTQCTYVLTSSNLRWYYNGPLVSWFLWEVSSSSGVLFDANILTSWTGNTLTPWTTLYTGTQPFSPFVSSLVSGNTYYWKVRPYVTWQGNTYFGDATSDSCFGVGGPPWFDIANDNCDPKVSKNISAIATWYTSTGLLVDIPAGVWNTWFFYKIITDPLDCSWFPTGFLSYTPGSNLTFWSWDNGKYVCFYARDEIGDQGYALSNPVCGIDSTLPSCSFDIDSTPGVYYQTGWVTYLNTWFLDFAWTGSELLSGVEFTLWAFTNIFSSVLPVADAGIYQNFFLGSSEQAYTVFMQCQDQVWFTGTASSNFFLDMTVPSMPVVNCSTSFFDSDFTMTWTPSLDAWVWFQSYDRQINRTTDNLPVLSDTVSTTFQNIAISSLPDFTGYSFTVRGCDFLWNCSAYSQCDFTVISPVCGDGVVSAPETCDDSNTNSWDGCSSTCTIESPSWGWWGGGWTTLTPDNCKWWDFSPSYYDKKCDAPPVVTLSSAPVTAFLDFCSYNDVNYLSIDFSDILKNRHKESINLLLDLCIVRWIPQKNIFLPAKSTTRWEFTKVVVKLLGAWSFEPQEANGNSSYYDAFGHWSATYFEEARKLWLLTDLEKRTNKWVTILPEAFIKQSEAKKILTKAFRLMGASQSNLTVLDAVFPKNLANNELSRDFFAGMIVKVFDLMSDDSIFFSYIDQVMNKNTQATLRALNIYKTIEQKKLSVSELDAFIKSFSEKSLYRYKQMNVNRALLLQKLNDLKKKSP